MLRGPVVGRLCGLVLAAVLVLPAAPGPVLAAVAPPAVPAIVTPVPGSHVGATPVLGWTPVAGAASYRVEIAGPSGFGTPLLARTTVNRWLTPAETLPSGAVVWRVAAVGGDGAAGAWAEADFTIDAGLATPVLAPATVTAPWPSEARVLSWDPVPGAAGYDVRLTGDPLDTLDDTDGFAWSGTRYVARPWTVSGALTGTIYWQVRARGAGGLARSAWSAVGELHSSWTAAPAPTTADGAVLTEEMLLDWEPLPGATRYTVEVEPLNGQGSIMQAGAAATRVVVSDFKEQNHYGAFRWHVRGVAAAGFAEPFGSAWSAWRTVTIVQADAPVPLAPADGATVPGTPRFSWTPVPRRDDYRVQVSTDPTFATGVTSLPTSDTAIEAGTESVWVGWSKPLDLADGETYYWRVQGEHRQDQQTEWSTVRSFTVDAPAISQYGPADGATVQVPTLTWDASRGRAFNVGISDRHGTPLTGTTTSAGRWTPAMRLDPKDGPFTWWVKAISLDDGTTVTASSGTRTFSVTALVATADEPVIADPPADEPWFTAAWTPVNGADHYTIVESWPAGDADVPLAVNLPYPAFTHPGPWVPASPDPVTGHPWRVIAYDADGTELSRGPARVIDIPTLPAPALLGPDGCSSADCGTPTSPTFHWDPVAGASLYVVSVTPVAYPQGGTSIQVEGTSARMAAIGIQMRGRLTWTVQACTATGCSASSTPRSYWWSRVIPDIAGPPQGATVEDEVTFGYTGGTPPEAAPGEEPLWTYQDPAFIQPGAAYTASDEPGTVTWGFDPSYGGPSRTVTLQASTPERVEPADGAATDATPLLRWTPLVGASTYAVQIHRGGSDPIGEDTLLLSTSAYDAAFTPLRTLAPGTYRWRVRRGTATPDGTPLPGGPWSEAWTFTVPAAAPAALDQPAPGSTRSPSDLLFTWAPVAGASAYRVELSRDADFFVLGYAATSAVAAWAPGAALSGGTWYWRVVALGGGDTPISTSVGRAITIDAPLLKTLRNAVVIDGGAAFATWHEVMVRFPIAAQTGAARVRLSNDGITWLTLPWQADGTTWDLVPAAIDLGNGETTARNGAYTVHGQWEDLDGNWSAVATDTVVFDADKPAATLTLDGGAATTADPEVVLQIHGTDSDGIGAAWVCNAGDCRYVAGGGAPIPWLLGDPDGAPGPREVCVYPYDVYSHWGTWSCATIDLTGSAPASTPPGLVGLRMSDAGFAPTHWGAGDTFTVAPILGAGRAPAGSDTCTWELRWGDHAALHDGTINGTGGGVSTSGTAAEGFCAGWTFTLPQVTAGMATISFTARTADGTLIAATPTAWADRARFRIWRYANAAPSITSSSLPLVNLAVEGSENPGESLTFSATPLGFTPASATLAARSTAGATATSADGKTVTVTAPEVGRWSVRWTGQRGGSLVAAYLDPTVTMLDVAAPRATAPVTKPRAGSVAGSVVPVRVSWTGSDAGSGLARFEVQSSRNGGPWTAVRLGAPVATSVDLSLATSGSYRYQVRGVDKAGNPGPWVAGPLVRPTLVPDSSATVHGTWRRAYAASYLGGSARYAASSGASATYAFTGASIAWVASRGPTRGTATVYLDGRRVGTVSLHSSTTQHRRMVFTAAWPTIGPHTIRIVVAGTSGHPRVDVDGFVVGR